MKHSKEKLSLKIPPVRNPFVVLALNKKAGSHRKSTKASRRHEKVDLKRVLNSAGQYLSFTPRVARFESGSTHQDY